MAAIEREKQEKKAARKAAKVRKPPDVSEPTPHLKPSFSESRPVSCFFIHHHHPLTRVPDLLATRQEAKKEERIAREEFALTGGNKKLTKKERKRLEQGEFE